MEIKGKYVLTIVMLMLIIVITSANTIDNNGNELISLPSAENILVQLGRVILPNHNLGCAAYFQWCDGVGTKCCNFLKCSRPVFGGKCLVE